MDKEWIASIEKQLDQLRVSVKALEDAVTQIPAINMQTDPSRLAGVVIEPEALVKK